MDYLAALILIVLTVVIYRCAPRSRYFTQLGGQGPAVTSAQGELSPYIRRQICEIKDVNVYLTRRIMPNNPLINALQTHSPTVGAEGLTPVSKPAPEEVNEQVTALVKEHQPFFLEDPHILERDGVSYYIDARYPRRPIPTSFLVDEAKFVRENPKVYPSYVIASRNLPSSV